MHGDRRVAGGRGPRTTGYSIDQLAAVTGFDTARMAELRGRRSLSDRTMDALRGMLSPHEAEAIAGFAGTSMPPIWSKCKPDGCEALL